jgi:DNA-binding transcriptional LysR family regulator
VIELRHLRYFVAVFEELHFGRAAERLHLAQPPLSQAIRKLEAELGVILFNRTSRVVKPTEAGEVLAEGARKVLASFDHAVAEARRAGGVNLPLRIGCVPFLSIERLLRFLTSFHESHPTSDTQVTHMLELEQVARLRRGDLDFGIFYEAQRHKGIEVEPIFAGDPLGAFLPPDHPLLARESLGPEDLKDEVLITFGRDANPALHEKLLELIGAKGYTFREVREAAGVTTRDLMVAVAEGAGVGFWPSELEAEGEVGSVVVRRPLDPPVSTPETLVAWATDPPRQPEKVIAAVRDVARALRDRELVPRA